MSNSSQNKIDEQIDRARERVIETISQNMHLYGVTPSIGRLYGILFFNEGPLTLDDMKEELQMSKTSMSTSVRTLTDLKMVEKVWMKGERKDLYTARRDWYGIFIDYFAHEWRKVIHSNLSAVDESITKLNHLLADSSITEEQKATITTDLNKLLYTKDYYQWQDRLFDFFETEEVFKAVERFTE